MRASGIIMHISSLPSAHGVGTLGKAAYAFVDFLAEAKQRFWQVLPLQPSGRGNSPYSALSAFAGNPLFIDLEQLVEEGWLTQQEVDAITWQKKPEQVWYDQLNKERLPLLHQAYERFIGMPNRDFLQFVQNEQSWLGEYSLFRTLQAALDPDWTQWPEEIRLRDPTAMAKYRTEYKYEIAFHYFLQYKFFEQWNRLHAYAQKQGVSIIGDVPIYMPLNCADVWANSDQFSLGPDSRPDLVAGCPPDYFSKDGQLWGNPLYRWDVMRRDGYRWWMQRLRAAAQMFDGIRLDHFRGFESYWAVPASHTTAREGSWCKGPGMDFLEQLRKQLPKTPFIAEDLGFLTPEVRKLQQESGFPGMKVLQFAFDAHKTSIYLPHCYERHCVCYTGTHDNATLRQWLQQAPPEDLAFARDYLALTEAEGYDWGVIRGGMGSVAELFIAQMQDYLGLDDRARMNVPGVVADTNWSWRVLPEQLTTALAQQIAQVTQRYGRWHQG